MVKVGNYLHIITILFAIVLIVVMYFILRKKPKDFAFKVLLIWCFVNFALHFLKQFYYLSFDSLRKSTAENICAVSTLVFPFIMLYKKESVFHDFMFFIGVLGGGLALLYPTEAINQSLFTFEVLRFYFCHISLLAIPLLLAMLGIYRPKLKNFWKIPLVFLLYEVIICFNTGFVVLTKLYVNSKYTAWELFFSNSLLNNAFVFGPTPDMGVLSDIYDFLCPAFLKIENFSLNGGNLTYIPVVWIIIPSFISFIPVYLLVACPFFILDFKHSKLK